MASLRRGSTATHCINHRVRCVIRLSLLLLLRVERISCGRYKSRFISEDRQKLAIWCAFERSRSKVLITFHIVLRANFNSTYYIIPQKRSFKSDTWQWYQGFICYYTLLNHLLAMLYSDSQIREHTCTQLETLITKSTVLHLFFRPPCLWPSHLTVFLRLLRQK